MSPRFYGAPFFLCLIYIIPYTQCFSTLNICTQHLQRCSNSWLNSRTNHDSLLSFPLIAWKRSRPQIRLRAQRTSTSLTAPGMTTQSDIASGAWPPVDRLGLYVTEVGLVDYTKLAAQEKEWLAPAIGSIKATDPMKMNAAERHAFLVNAYNLWTLHWVIRERRRSKWQGVISTFAKARFFYWHKVSTGAGNTNLFRFENKVIRPEVNDARVHFALNCASMSCPPLRRTLFTGDNLDHELDEVTSNAINGGAVVQVTSSGSLRLNPIFKWYKQDFDKEGGVLAFIRKHWKGATPLPAELLLEYFDYDWRTNSVDATWADRALGGPAP